MADFKAKVQAWLDTSKLEQQLKALENGKHKIKVDVDTGKTDKGVQNVNKQIQNAGKTAKSTGNTLKNALNIGGAAAVAAKSIQLIGNVAKSTAQSISEIDKAIVSLQMATGENRSTVTGMVNDYNKMAQAMGATTTQVTAAADAWLRQGKTAAETNELIKASMMLSKITNMESADATSALTSTINGYKKEASDAVNIVSALSAVDLESASNASGLAIAMSKCASSANLAGVSMEKLIGYIAAVKDTTGQSDEVIGNAFKSIFARINQVKAGAKIDEAGESLNNVEKVLGEVGISLRKSNREFESTEKILDNVASKWNVYDDVTKKKIATNAAGSYQYERFISLMDNYSKAIRFTETAMNSAGTAEKKFESWLDSLEAKTNTLQAAFESLALNNISTSVVGGILDASTAVLKFVDNTNLLKSTFASLAIAGVVKGFVLLRTGIMSAATSLTAFGTAMQMVSGTQVLANDFENLVALTGNLSKSQLKAVVSSEALTNAQRMAILTSTGMSEAEASAALASMGLATAEVFMIH